MFSDDMKPCEVMAKILKEQPISFEEFKKAVIDVAVRHVPSRITGKFDILVEVDSKQLGSFCDYFMMDGVDDEPPARSMAIEAEFERLSDKVMRGGQMNINGVFISGYERIVLLKRKLKKYAWQANHVEILLCKDSWTGKYLMQWNAQLPTSTKNRLHHFLLWDIPNEIETKREAIEKALEEMEAELPRIEQMVESQADRAMFKRLPKILNAARIKLNLGVI